MNEKIKILIVDDDNLLRRILSDRLSFKGYEISTAIDGEDGLQKAKLIKPDLIITDVMMPKMDGFELCKKIREDEIIKSIPVIILTSRDQTADKIKGLKIGGDDYLIKPFDPEELEARIESLLRRTIPE